MPWSASIQSIHDTPVPSGKKVVNVHYTDGAARQIRRTYHLGADQIDSAQEVAEFLQAEVAKLDTADAIATDLEAILGQEITAVSAPAQYGVPKVISDRQFFQALALMGVITKQEAKEAVQTGTIPAAMQAIVDTITDETERFSTEMILSGAVEFRRDHPLVAVFAAASNMSKEYVDNIFTLGASL